MASWAGKGVSLGTALKGSSSPMTSIITAAICLGMAENVALPLRDGTHGCRVREGLRRRENLRVWYASAHRGGHC
jgi:hypothetical protein